MSRTFWTVRTVSGPGGRRIRRWRLSGSRRWTWVAAGWWRWTSGSSSITHLDTLLKTQVLELPRLQLLESGQRSGSVGKEIQFPLGVSGHLDRPIVDAIIDPVRRDLQRHCDLRYRQASRNPARMRLTALD